eukprot:46784-Rhodomonas_salina.1
MILDAPNLFTPTAFSLELTVASFRILFLLSIPHLSSFDCLLFFLPLVPPIPSLVSALCPVLYQDPLPSSLCKFTDADTSPVRERSWSSVDQGGRPRKPCRRPTTSLFLSLSLSLSLSHTLSLAPSPALTLLCLPSAP